MQTVTITYKLGITNLEFTVGLTENQDHEGNKANDWLIPRTLRINDKAVESSNNAEFVDFIFSKRAIDAEYSECCYATPGVVFPENVRVLLSDRAEASLVNHQKLNWTE